MNPLLTFALKQAFSIITNTMNSIATASYRTTVLNALAAIQAGIAAIEADIILLMALGELRAMRDAMDQADVHINTYYTRPEFQGYLNQSSLYPNGASLPLDLQAEIRNNVKNYLQLLHEAIMGNGQDGSPFTTPWMTLWINAYQGNLNTSVVESAFQLFYGYMLTTQLRGLALLSALDDVGGWDGYLQINFGHQAIACQNTVNALSDDDSWTGGSAGSHVATVNTGVLTYGGWAGIPQGNVLINCAFAENQSGQLILKVWSAPLLPYSDNSPGFVDTTQIATNYAEGSAWDIEIYDRQGNNGKYPTSNTATFYVNGTPLEVPDGNVIVDIQINIYEAITTYGPTPDSSSSISGMYLAIQYAPINDDGTLGDALTMIPPVDEGTQGTGPTSPAQFTNSFDYDNPQTSSWTTPATGVRLIADENNDGYIRLHCAYAIHKNSFAAPLS